MKKHTKILLVLLAVVLLLVLFFPIPLGTFIDGGTKIYIALTYEIVSWNKFTEDGVYKATRIYWFPDYPKSLDELFEEEKKRDDFQDYIVYPESCSKS